MFSMLSKLWKVEFYFEIYNQFLGELWFLSAYSFSSFLWWEGGAASVPDPYQSCKSLKIFLIPLLAQQGSSGVALHYFSSLYSKSNFSFASDSTRRRGQSCPTWPACRHQAAAGRGTAAGGRHDGPGGAVCRLQHQQSGHGAHSLEIQMAPSWRWWELNYKAVL